MKSKCFLSPEYSSPVDVWRERSLAPFHLVARPCSSPDNSDSSTTILWFTAQEKKAPSACPNLQKCHSNGILLSNCPWRAEDRAGQAPEGIASSFAAFARYDWGTNVRGEGMNPWLRLLAILVTLILIGSPAAAHPHVWVLLKSQILYDEAGLVTGVRHVWTFDDLYSAFLTQDINREGKEYSPARNWHQSPKKISSHSKTMTISRRRRSMAARPRLGHLSNIGLNRKTDR
jgi:hypothetical protein